MPTTTSPLTTPRSGFVQRKLLQIASAGVSLSLFRGEDTKVLKIIRFVRLDDMSRQAGRSIESGPGPMGVTYKAFDTVLQHPVALKVIDLLPL